MSVITNVCVHSIYPLALGAKLRVLHILMCRNYRLNKASDHMIKGTPKHYPHAAMDLEWFTCSSYSCSCLC